MPNRLAQETSPYLQQHAGNPVDWHPWNDEALALARAQDKPILLSVGYSACHWCHVMAHESFEDPAVAAAMNRHFINIKVDREERPDLDQIYQTAHAMLTRRNGGWPLTMFLLPDGTPYFGGTYFPKQARHGLPGFLDLLPRVAEAYHTRRSEIAEQSAALRDALARTLPQAPSEGALKRAPLEAALGELVQIFDEEDGGLGQAPKFPHPHELAFCLRRHALDGSDMALALTSVTLTKMAEGGIYDHLGGGFCRYSVDAHWTIPHFEKMLYDNGPLLALYSDAWLVTGEPRFSQVVSETAAWVMREMQSPDGGYYSSLDADSEHVEGKFYVWTPDEVRALLTEDEYRVTAAHYGLEGAPNFEDRFWHLRVSRNLPAIAQALGRTDADCEALLASARAKLFAARENRVHPGRDEKILVSWNALMIRGMAHAARVFGRDDWLDSAQRAADYIRCALWRDGRLLATAKDGRAHLNAYLDDHAFLLEALLELMQTRFRAEDIDFARALAELLLSQFEDGRQGGFFFTSHDHEQLILRSKPGHENATPSGNGIAALALQRLGHLIGEPRYLATAERTVRLFYPAIERNASAFASLATALEETITPPQCVILRGPDAARTTWQRRLATAFRPNALIIAVPEDSPSLPAALDKPSARPEVTAWVCRGSACLPAIDRLDALIAELAQ
jgi:uncharacterized protein YyaL (SSP411 family)